MEWLVSTTVICPHCGEEHPVTIDTTQGRFVTTEDCTVCCAPMELTVECSPGEVESMEVALG